MNPIIQGLLVLLALFMTWGGFVIGDYMYLIWGPFSIFLSGFLLIYNPYRDPLTIIFFSIPMGLGFFMIYKFKKNHLKKEKPYIRGEM